MSVGNSLDRNRRRRAVMARELRLRLFPMRGEVGDNALDQLALRFEAFAVRDADAVLKIADISDALGVSERTLRAHVTHLYGVPPNRLLRTYRMQLAQAALKAATPGTTTVTDVPIRFGFT